MTHDTKTLTRLLEDWEATYAQLRHWFFQTLPREARDGFFKALVGEKAFAEIGGRHTLEEPLFRAALAMRKAATLSDEPEYRMDADEHRIMNAALMDSVTVRSTIPRLSDEGLVGRLEKALQRCEGPDAYANAIVDGNDLRAAIAALSMGSSR